MRLGAKVYSIVNLSLKRIKYSRNVRVLENNQVVEWKMGLERKILFCL